METHAQNLDKILDQVGKLLRLADHPNTPPHEADTARRKAELLMFKYRIDEMQVTDKAEAGVVGIAPSWRTVTLCNGDSEFAMHYRYIWSSVLTHVGCRGVTMTVANASADGKEVVANAVGYESDLRYAELLFTAAALEFGKRLEPKYDRTLSNQVNAYLMRSAGMEGRRIAEAIYGRDDKALRPKVRKMFADEAKLRGEDPAPLLGRGVNVKAFRKSYADGFNTEFWNRLYLMRGTRGEVSVGLELASRKEAIDEAFYTKYPQFRPVEKAGSIGTGADTCVKCAKAKSGYCRDHSFLRPRYGKDTTNYEGLARGAAAARNVDIGGATGSIAKEKKEIG